MRSTISCTLASSIPTNACPAFTSFAPAWNANRSSPSRRSASTISVVLPTPGSPMTRTDRGRDEERAPTRASTAAIRLPTSVAGGLCARVDDAPERAEEVDIDRRRPPLLECGPERGLRRDVGPVDQLADERLQTGIERLELGNGQVLPGCDTRVEEARDLPHERAARPVLLCCREHRGNHLPVACRRARGAAAAAHPTRRARSDFRQSPSKPGRRRAAGGDRGHGAGAKELRTPERDVRERLVIDARGIGEQLDEPFEFVVELELIDVDPRIRRLEFLPELDHLLDWSLPAPRTLQGILLLH